MKIKTATRNGGTSATGSPTCLIFAFEIQRKIAVTCSHHTHFSYLFLYPFFSHFHPLKYILILSHAYAAHMHTLSQPWCLQYLAVSTHYNESRCCNSQIVCHLNTPSRVHTHAWPPLACNPKHPIIFILYPHISKLNSQKFSFQIIFKTPIFK